MKEKLLKLDKEARKTGLKINVQKNEEFESQPHKGSYIHQPAGHY